MRPWILCWKKIDEIGVPEVITICLIRWRVTVGPGLSEECSRSSGRLLMNTRFSCFPLRCMTPRPKKSFPKWACTQTRAFHSSLSLHARRLSCTTVFLMRLNFSLSALWPRIRHRLTPWSTAWSWPWDLRLEIKGLVTLNLEGLGRTSYKVLEANVSGQLPASHTQHWDEKAITQKCYRSSVMI